MISFKIKHDGLRVGQEGTIIIFIRNQTTRPMRKVSLSIVFSPEIGVLDANPDIEVRYLPPATSYSQEFKCRPIVTGQFFVNCPEIYFMDGNSMKCIATEIHFIKINLAENAICSDTYLNTETYQKGRVKNSQEIRVLFISSTPRNSTDPGSGREFDIIRDQITGMPLEKQIEFNPILAVRTDRVNKALHSYKPHIIHFSGHCGKDGNLIFENETGLIHRVTIDSIVRLFSNPLNYVSCFILNGCFTYAIATALAPVVPFLIGYDGEVDENVCIAFSSGFYTALASGLSFSEAMKVGRHQLDLRFPDCAQNLCLYQQGKLISFK